MAPKLIPSGSQWHDVPRGTATQPTVQHQPIAIVGVSCKFAGEADNASRLWELCEAGKSAWSPIPPERLDVKSSYHPDKERPGRNHATGGYFFRHDIASFDAGFFSLSAEVASAMDPQLRLLLESVYEATEDAGIPLQQIAGTNTSVFTGCWGQDYHDLQARDPDILPSSFLTGNGTAMLSNRISHFFDLQGASMSIDSGCSSGLVAMHQACRSILWGDSDMSIVTASSAMLSPDLFTALSSLSMTGADGKCYAWDSRAQGYGRGEGVASLILKPLDAALQNGDHIHALVRHTGLGQDGKTKTLTSPSVAAQVRLIEQCYKRAGLSLSETGYVEAHMTGTLIGDSTEAEALATTFGKGRAADDPVLVGSVKTNIGHTEAVSGLAAIIKTIWVLKMRQIPPNLNYKTPNADIPLQEWNLKVPTSLTDWPRNKPLRASINNFGYGGTNAHIILEGAPEYSKRTKRPQSNAIPRDRIFVVSAKDSVALESMMAKLANHVLTSVEDEALGDLAFTLSERRSRLPLAAAVRAGSRDDLVNRLKKWSRKPSPAVRPPRLGFVFNGQGAQWHAMGRELIEAYPVFASSVKRAEEILRASGSTWSLHDELMRDAESTRVSEVNLSQPITVALQLCLVDLLRSWNIMPSAITSHSSGEIAAAYAAGRLSFGEALGVAYWRGELALRNKRLRSLSGGMMAVRLSAHDVAKYITDTPVGKVVVACVNSPTSVTLSGDVVALDEVRTRLEADGISPRKLDVPLAYHSHHMLAMGQEYTERLKGFLATNHSTQEYSGIRFASPVTGDIVESSEAFTPEHWTRNLTNTVLFSQALERMCFTESGSTEVDMILEVGAHGTLAGPIRQILKGRETPYASCLQRSVNAVETMQNLACELIMRGHPVSLRSINAPVGGEIHSFLHDLPTYAWNHTSRYWMEPRISREMRHKKFEPHELLGSLLPGDNGLFPTWRNFLRLADIPWLVDHQLDSQVVLPTAAYISMAVEAVRLVRGLRDKDTRCQFQLRDVDFLNGLGIPDSSAGIEVQLNLRPVEGGWYEFTISSLSAGDDWLVNCKGQALAMEEEATGSVNATLAADFVDSDIDLESTKVDVDSFYSTLADGGLSYGPSFRSLTAISTAGSKSITDFEVSKIVSEAQDYYIIHPATLDSIMQSAYNGVPEEVLKAFMVLPQSIDSILIGSTLSRQSGEQLQARTKTQLSDKQVFTSEISAINKGGAEQPPALHIVGLLARALPRNDISDFHSLDQQPLTSRLEWELDAWTGIPPVLKDSMRITLGDEQAAFEKNMMRLSYYLIHDAVQELQGSSAEVMETWQPHHNRLLDWMKETVVRGEAGVLSWRSKAWSRAGKGAKQILVDQMNASGDASARLVIRVGKKLAQIVRGEITPVEVMMEAGGNLLNQYYMDSPRLKDRTYKHLSEVARLLSISRPGAKILEIGAGTGGATSIVLEAFSPKSRTSAQGSLVEHYTFTDVSSAFFEPAKAKFASWIHLMDFKALNIEADAERQSIAEGSYDIIVASLVLHATKSLHETMSNVRRLLKPGGKLILVETSTDRLDMQLVSGTFPGWWLGKEPDRKESPNVPLQTWDRVLRDTGFTGIDFDIGDCEEAEFQCTSLIVSTAATNASHTFPTSISIVQPGTPSSGAFAWAQQLSEAIHQRIGVTPRLESFDNVHDWTDKVCIFAAEMDGPFVHGMNKAVFDNLRGLLTRSRGLLWVSCGGNMCAGQPSYAMVQGLLRTVRQEDTSKRIVQLDFAPNKDGENWTTDKIYHIVDIFQRNFDSSQESVDQDNEFSVRDSMTYVPRVYPNVDVQEISDLPPLPIADSEAAYLIVGGMGGIGRAIVAWMVEKGAKNLLVVSRTADKHIEAAQLSADARARGCNLQFRSCDISSGENLVSLLADCSKTLPPVRGVVHAAMVLDDTVLERMTWDQWNRATQAKVAISMNLHSHLTDLQFFVLLSSVTGVAGHMSQANYAAGNTFQDALARHRTAQGLPAVALDLSAVDSAGWVAQQADPDRARRRIEGLGATSMSVNAVLELLEAAIRDPLRAAAAESQVIVGLSRYATIPDDSVTKRDRRFGTLRMAPDHAMSGKMTASGGETPTGAAKDSTEVLLAAVAAGRQVPVPELTQLVVNAVADKLAVIFNVDPSVIDPEVPLSQYGVDSLVAVDVRNWLANRLKARVSVSDITQAASLPSLAVLAIANSSAHAMRNTKAQGIYFLGEREFLDVAEHSVLSNKPDQDPLQAGPSAQPPPAWKDDGQVVMGLRSALHLEDPNNRCNWRRDRGMGSYHNIRAGQADAAASSDSGRAQGTAREGERGAGAAG